MLGVHHIRANIQYAIYTGMNILSVPVSPLKVGIPMVEEKRVLDAKEAGRLIKQKRQARGLTQDQLVSLTGIPSQSYLSSFENGRYHIGKSEYFPAIIRELGLTDEEVSQINPDMIIRPRQTIDIQLTARNFEFPPGLQEAIDKFGEAIPELRDPVWQKSLTELQMRGPAPETADEWAEYVLFVRKYVRPPRK